VPKKDKKSQLILNNNIHMLYHKTRETDKFAFLEQKKQTVPFWRIVIKIHDRGKPVSGYFA
jgi:hypothetical protein